MPQTQTLLEHLRTYLISQGIGRLPTTNDPSKHPIWLSPRTGVYAVGEQPRGGTESQIGVDAVIALYEAPGIPPRRHESFLRTDGVDIRVRVRNPPIARQIDIDLRAALNDKRGWNMDSVPIQESLLWRDMQPLLSDENGWTYVCGYVFEVFEIDYAQS